MSFKAKLQPSQIVRLECQTACLYSEIVQIVEERQLYWVRPIALADRSTSHSDPHQDIIQPLLYDLREGVDLLCPASLFQPALDTEILPILTELEISKSEMERLQPDPSQMSASHQQLRTFIQCVWKTYPEAF